MPLQDVHAVGARVDGLGEAACLNHGWAVYVLLWHSDAYRQSYWRVCWYWALAAALPSRQPATPRGKPLRPRSRLPHCDNRPAIVAFGDSLTAGFGADPGKSYPDFLQQETGSPRPALPGGERGASAARLPPMRWRA